MMNSDTGKYIYMWYMYSVQKLSATSPMTTEVIQIFYSNDYATHYQVNKSTYLHDHSITCTVHVTNLPYINCFHLTIMRCDIHQCSYVLKLCLPINSISQIG